MLNVLIAATMLAIIVEALVENFGGGKLCAANGIAFIWLACIE